MNDELTASLVALEKTLQQHFADAIIQTVLAKQELTLELHPHALVSVCQQLRDDPRYLFAMLIDVCGVDYLHFGLDEWQTLSATTSGFSRGFENTFSEITTENGNELRFAVVYHLLSLQHNMRLRLKVKLPAAQPEIHSVIEIWPSANWFEREVFDLFGILFHGHPDLRRILTDYGFLGHPFRKDFPQSGHVEVRYDALQKRVLYEPVDIEPRILEPKVIRKDNRYWPAEGE